MPRKVVDRAGRVSVCPASPSRVKRSISVMMVQARPTIVARGVAITPITPSANDSIGRGRRRPPSRSKIDEKTEEDTPTFCQSAAVAVIVCFCIQFVEA
mmetsp:Transcript_26699/g.61442  ORF Transcript_26699/g.61442 Transcript_26699/m.61442 type:complete len:99 (-) Transcript_26699:666-962(-)